MFDISNQKLDLKCPNCGRAHRISLDDIERERTIPCGCGKNIKLNDANGSVKRSIGSVNQSLRKLENTLKKFGK